MMTRQMYTIGDIRRAFTHIHHPWKRLMKAKPFYDGVVEGMLENPMVQWLLDYELVIRDIPTQRKRLRSGIAIGYSILGQEVMEELLLHGGAVDTVLTLAAVTLDGEDDQVFDAQSIYLVELLATLGQDNTPTDPAIHAMQLLEKLSVPEDYRHDLKYTVLDRLLNSEKISIH